MVFTVRDGDGRVLAHVKQMVSVGGLEIPSFGYSFQLFDDGSGQSEGDGDGLPEVGEVVDLAIDVTNLSEVDAVEAFAKLRNLSGRDVDLRMGTLELGAPAAGETVSGRFTFAIRSAPEAGEIELELAVGDNELYDYGAVLRAGFYDYATIGEQLAIPVFESEATEGEVSDLIQARKPPELTITRQPELIVDEPWVVLSGQVKDDGGVEDVIVFHTWQDHPDLRDAAADSLEGEPQVLEDTSAREAMLAGEQKVYYRGGSGGIKLIPFTVEQELREGSNTFVILAHDDRGLTLARAVSVYYDPPTTVSQAE